MSARPAKRVVPELVRASAARHGASSPTKYASTAVSAAACPGPSRAPPAIRGRWRPRDGPCASARWHRCCARVSSIARRNSMVPASSASWRCIRVSRRSCWAVSRARSTSSRGIGRVARDVIPPASCSASERARTASAVRNACHAPLSLGRRRPGPRRFAPRTANNAPTGSARAIPDWPTSREFGSRSIALVRGRRDGRDVAERQQRL